MSNEQFIGLMSGTSMDGIDAALVEFGSSACRLIATHYQPYSPELRERLRRAVDNASTTSFAEIAALDQLVAAEFSAAAEELKAQSVAGHSNIAAIGSHGQTVLHQPENEPAFTVQIGDPSRIAARTGLTVVAHFRGGDIALGGQGAPLAPAFHHWAFGAAESDRAVVNIGGIANITHLPAGGSVSGFDTGPGNILLDHWCQQHHGQPFDDGGAWAASGAVDSELLRSLKSEAYFAQPAPKSTGADYFNGEWLRQHINRCASQPSYPDVQATLSQLTAELIAAAIGNVSAAGICGGGAHNHDLVSRITAEAPQCDVASTDAWGLDPDWVEAAAFAWMARERLAGRPSNQPRVTGASARLSLGGVFLPPA